MSTIRIKFLRRGVGTDGSEASTQTVTITEANTQIDDSAFVFVVPHRANVMDMTDRAINMSKKTLGEKDTKTDGETTDQ